MCSRVCSWSPIVCVCVCVCFCTERAENTVKLPPPSVFTLPLTPPPPIHTHTPIVPVSYLLLSFFLVLCVVLLVSPLARPLTITSKQLEDDDAGQWSEFKDIKQLSWKEKKESVGAVEFPNLKKRKKTWEGADHLFTADCHNIHNNFQLVQVCRRNGASGYS